MSERTQEGASQRRRFHMHSNKCTQDARDYKIVVTHIGVCMVRGESQRFSFERAKANTC